MLARRGNVPCGDRFTVSIPYCGDRFECRSCRSLASSCAVPAARARLRELSDSYEVALCTVYIIFNCKLPDVPPDLVLPPHHGVDHLTCDGTSLCHGSAVQSVFVIRWCMIIIPADIPSVREWDASNRQALLRICLDVRYAYLQRQRALLAACGDMRATFDLDMLQSVDVSQPALHAYTAATPCRSPMCLTCLAPQGAEVELTPNLADTAPSRSPSAAAAGNLNQPQTRKGEGRFVVPLQLADDVAADLSALLPDTHPAEVVGDVCDHGQNGG